MDESATIQDIRQRIPRFFRNSDGTRKTHGRNESYSVHRGFLIVRNKVDFSPRFGTQWTETKFTIYSVHHHVPDKGWTETCIMCKPDATSHRQARKYIDKLLDEVKEYNYGVDLS